MLYDRSQTVTRSPANARLDQQTGFSLVELMVALVVGLLLLTGVLQILLSNREGFDAQRATARVQENARLATFVLEHSIAHAGYLTELDDQTTAIFPSRTDAPGFTAGAVISGQSDSQGSSDTLRVRFQGRGGVRDCRGRDIGDVTSPEMADMTFYVNGDDTLICRGTGGDFQPLVENVDRFEVRYGIDTNSTIGVDRYVSSLVGVDSGSVRSVRFQLLLRSKEDEQALPAIVNRIYEFTNGPPVSVNDRLARMLVDQTVALKNRLP